MHPFKEFITDQRNIELKEAYVIINVNISPKLYDYLNTLDNIAFTDGEYHKYCGEVKILINNFINYWTEVINECVREADTFLQTVNKRSFVALIDDTEDVQRIKQEEFIKAFEPDNAEEQKILDDINEKYILRLEELKEMKRVVKNLENKEMVYDFLKIQLDLSISKKNEAFEMAHTNMARHLAKQTYKIKISFEEILLRLSNNLKNFKEKKSDKLNSLMEELYDANKDRMMVSRQERHRSSDTAEVDYVIQKIRDEIERRHIENPMANLEDEVAYWEKRLDEFCQIEKTLKKIETELEHVTEYLERYNSVSTTEYPGSKKTCWLNMGENYRRRKASLENSLLETSKALMTFFAIRGQNRIFYKDKIGTYAIDDYGHQVYFFDNGKQVCHLTCDGKLVEFHDLDKYYFDEVGRYILGKDGEKIYQCAPCTSSYKLTEAGLLEKMTKDCGHSDTPNPDCRLTIKNPNEFELLPSADPVDIKQTLSPEVAKYLWDSVAYVLPDALYDTGMKRPLNPIYYLTNRLFHHKYHKNNLTQLKEKYKEAEKFKADIYQKRKEKAVAEALAFKAKQVRPRKPEESDDTQMMQVLAAHAATQQLKDQLTYYEYN